MSRKSKAETVALEDQPGYYIRRLQQIAVAIFLQDTEGFGVTPVQYGVLLTVSRQPGLDQRTLAALMGLDTSTTAGVVDRLDGRGLLRRSASPTDKRVKLLSVTPEGQALLADIEPHVLAAQDRILALDCMYLNGMLLMLVLGIQQATMHYFEAALLVALLGFVGTTAMAKFLLRGEVIE